MCGGGGGAGGCGGGYTCGIAGFLGGFLFVQEDCCSGGEAVERCVQEQDVAHCGSMQAGSFGRE